MYDVSWKGYYFDTSQGIDYNADGKVDNYPKRSDVDIYTPKMPINYFNLVSYLVNHIKAGYKVKGAIDLVGNPDSAWFDISWLQEGVTHTAAVPLNKKSGNTYAFEWIITLETDDDTFIKFDHGIKKGSSTFGNEKWKDTWAPGNNDRHVFYVKGKASDDLIYQQSQ